MRDLRVRGPVSAADEFVELYNLSTSAVDISGWKVNGSNSSGTTSTRATVPASTTIGAGCFYLVANSTATTGYSGTVPADLTYTTGITDDGGIGLLMADNTIVDAVGMSTGSAYKEGTPLASLGTSNLDRGYERRPGGAAGNGQDTDDNSADFQLITPSAPQNSSSPCIGGTSPTNPTGVGAADPATVAPGGTSLLTVTVTPGTNPASTGIAVSADLSAIGGSATQSFFDDGTNGDVTAGDNVFSFSATISAATAPGAKSLPASISDAQSRTGSATISLTVASPAGGVVISKVYGGGGNAGATYTNDFIELFNASASAVTIDGWSVQYRAQPEPATGR
jgi:uncharacterized protein